MDIPQLKYVIEIARHSSFSKAAKALYITQPTLSQQIQRLEKEIGLKIFNRTTRHVSLTDAGYIFIKHSRQILTEVNRLESTIKRLKKQNMNQLAIGTPNLLKQLKVMNIIASFMASHSETHIQLHSNWTESILELLTTNRLDLAFLNLYETDLENKDLGKIILGKEKVYALMHKKHPLAEKKVISPHDLVENPLVLLNARSTITKLCHQVFDYHHVNLNVLCYCSGIDSLLAMICANIGISLLPEAVIKEHERDDLVCVNFEPEVFMYPALVYNKEAMAQNTLKEFIAYFYAEASSIFKFIQEPDSGH